MGNKRLYLIDATAFCYRAFYALKGLSTSFGQPTNAIYGFLNILNKILKAEKPDYLAVCFDVSRETFRAKKFAEYKINRPPMPEGLSSQVPIIKEIVAAYGIPIFQKQGFEADDIIATLASKAKSKGLSITIISSDKDILQLVDEFTVVFSPYKDEGVTYTSKKVLERYGVPAQKVTDIIALMGDQADNIPGIPGIGEKTATELISSFGSLEDLLKNVDKINQEKIRKSIEDNIVQLKLNKELTDLDKEVDIDFNLEKIRIGKPDFKELYKLFKRLEFKKFLKELPVEDSKGDVVRLEKYQDRQLKKVFEATDELILLGDSLDALVFLAKDKFFRVESPGENLKSILEDERIKKISHHLKNIRVSLANEGITLKGVYFDTMIAAYLLNPSKGPGYDLSDLALDYLNEPIGGMAADGQAGLELLHRLQPRLEKELHEKELFKLFAELEMPLVEVLAKMEISGIKIDTLLLKGLSRDIEKRLIKLIDGIYEMSGTQFNINSPKQLSAILFEKLKLPVVKKTKTGLSTDEEVLRKLAGKHKLPALLLEYRQLTKLKTTYIDALPELINKKTGRIHASFNQAGTETGRLSSSNPNLQNIPVKTDIGRNIRKAIISSSEKNYLFSCDYSQVELRILAHLSKDKNLTLSFKQEKDVHKETAALIYGEKEQDITDSMRDVAKRVNFGIIYGLTSYGLSRDLNISVEEAQNFIDAYFTTYPQVKDYIETQIKKAQKCGFVSTILGRRRYLPEINNKNMGIRSFAQRQAVNTPIQGSAADLIKLAMIKINEELSRKNLKSQLIMQIHDELVFDVPHQESGELAELARERMENVLKLDVPIRVDIKKGKNWLEMEPV
ncbi:MAG: DNA polymerase I [Candidatus Omnitrophota bacterium]